MQKSSYSAFFLFFFFSFLIYCEYYQYISLSVWIPIFEGRLCIDYPFHLLFSQQVTAAASIDMIPRHSFSRWLTSQDGRLWNYLRQGSIVLTEVPYSTARFMDLFSEEAMTFTCLHLVKIQPTLAILTAHQAGTTITNTSPRHFWQALITLLQTK